MFVYLFFRFWVFIFRLMPYKMMYGLSNFIAFLLCRILHYRYNVIDSNLSIAFPEIKGDEKKKIIRQVYRNLSDLIVESVKGFSMSEREIKKRFVVKNADILEPYRLKNKSVIALTAHTGNWEWGILAAPFATKMLSVGLYKPLSNKPMDDYLKRNRCRNGAHLTSIYVTAMSFQKYINESSLVMMVADQSPSNVRKSFWVNFLGKDTACLHGPEKYSKLYDLPVLYFNVHRIKRGYYEVELSHITDEPKSMPEGEITRLYMNHLEKYIRTYPANWLWSHRRWKHNR